MNSSFTDYLLKVTKSTECSEIETIQTLWSGYGKISRYSLHNSSNSSVVVKFISIQQSDNHPRGWNTEYSHNRKVKSYQVETYWYQKWSLQCQSDCMIPKLIGYYSEGSNQWIVLEDLNKNFPLRKTYLDITEVKVCLKWLAHFHATFLNQTPSGLWDVGTYWNLATRPDEFEKIEHQELKSKAHEIDALLNQCTYQTIVHGDAKVANFCFSQDGKKVAAVDFQYVGGGCGMKDVAYFLGSCLSSDECELHESELLDFYFSEFKNASASNLSETEFKELESEWRKMYPITCVDFMRFLMGWMPSHQKINNYNLNMINTVLSAL